MSVPVVELSDVSKDYRGLRPLRLDRLVVGAGERIAVIGFDQTVAEVFVNLVTGATLPDRGEVKLFGRPTAAIQDSADWLSVVDRFGIVSERAVLLDGLSVVQNLAMPFTLEIEPPPEDIRARAVALAHEVCLSEGTENRPVAELDAGDRARVRLGRALAHDPTILLLEHATAGLTEDRAHAFGDAIASIAGRRGVAVLALTADEAFGRAMGARLLRHEPASGRLIERRRFHFF